MQPEKEGTFHCQRTLKHNLGIISGDIGNQFCTAPCKEKIWSVAGDQFQNRKGCVVVLKRALYRLKTAPTSFHQVLGDFLTEMSFASSRTDQDPWLRRLVKYKRYDYIATHADDIIIVAKNPSKYMVHIKQHFQVHNVTDSPSYYIENDMMQQGKLFYMSTKIYTKEVLRKHQEKYGSLAKEILLLCPKEKPELDDTPFVDEEKHKEYQHIIQ
eukprot:14783863-Ditylum_brightwellii.AAC.1